MPRCPNSPRIWSIEEGPAQKGSRCRLGEKWGWHPRYLRAKTSLRATERPPMTEPMAFNHRFVRHALGYHPLFYAGVCLREVFQRPFLGSVYVMAGYCFSAIRRRKRLVSGGFARFLRKEQMARLFPCFRPSTPRLGADRREERGPQASSCSLPG